MLNTFSQPTRAWIGRIGLALAIGVGLGLLAYLAARGIAGAVLLSQQREILGDITGFSLDTPPAADFRATRKALQALDAAYQQSCILTGLLVGSLAAIAMYLRLERTQ